MGGTPGHARRRSVEEGSMSETTEERGVIRGQALLDLSHLTSPEQLAAISRIDKVATVIVPEALAGAYAAIPTTRIATTVYVPEGSNVRIHTGPLTTGGAGLGGPEDVLVVIGLLIITSPVTGPVPRRISVIGSVIAPRGSESALGPALGGGVGDVSYYRYVDGQDVRVFAGQVTLSAATLANSDGSQDDVLVAAGQVVVTGPVTDVGFAQLIVSGQLALPSGSRAALEQRTRVNGQLIWYHADEPRVVIDNLSVGPAFFRLLERPISFILLGNLTVEHGVTEEMIREKVTDIAMLGDVIAPAELIPVLQVLATETLGRFRVADGPGR
jgi:hypothetical protein